eukprot:1150193-Pleurochrysis_carterae.AAC.1
MKGQEEREGKSDDNTEALVPSKNHAQHCLERRKDAACFTEWLYIRNERQDCANHSTVAQRTVAAAL